MGDGVPANAKTGREGRLDVLSMFGAAERGDQ